MHVQVRHRVMTSVYLSTYQTRFQTAVHRMLVRNHTFQDVAGFTESEYRTHMEARKDSLAQLGEIFLEDSMVRCVNSSTHMEC